MYHKKIKTQPNLSTANLFMRKPSKQFLKNVTLNKSRLKEQPRTLDSQDNFLSQKVTEIGFISTINKKITASTDKQKKNTIELSRFRIKHENLLLRTQNEQLKKNTIELEKYNNELLAQVQHLRNQLQKPIPSQSKISSFSQQTTTNSLNKTLHLLNDSKHHSSQVLQLNCYNLLKSEANILSSLVLQPINQLMENHILSGRIEFLEKQLESSLDGIHSLQLENQRLSMNLQMINRRLYQAENQLKRKVIEQRKKQYFDKLFDLSSEDDNLNDY